MLAFLQRAYSKTLTCHHIRSRPAHMFTHAMCAFNHGGDAQLPICPPPPLTLISQGPMAWGNIISNTLNDNRRTVSIYDTHNMTAAHTINTPNTLYCTRTFRDKTIHQGTGPAHLMPFYTHHTFYITTVFCVHL